MPAIRTLLSGDNAWPDLLHKKIIHLTNDAPDLQVAILKGGMASGLPSLAIRIDLPDGRVVIAETSAKVFVACAEIIMAQHPELKGQAVAVSAEPTKTLNAPPVGTIKH